MLGELPEVKPQKTNYMFDGWYTGEDGGGTLFAVNTIVTGDMTVYAKWMLVPDGWTYDAATGGMTKDFSYTGASQTVTLPIQGGKYTFKLWGAN
jgi:uncharacterized repeat protein (TIGR02543 family)